ncbi:MAG TPA: hypothetical protein VFI31_27370 [Pirellulales bacterium]|nr:hypothetical protein [Pirellulales bacterium]
MSIGDGTEPVDRDESLYRRIPASTGWYSASGGLSPRAFSPRPDDITGLSFARSKYLSVEQAARGSGKAGYYIAVLPVAKLLDAGLTVVPRPLPENPGHVELIDLTYANRKSDASLGIMTSLAEKLTTDVQGPFF